MPEGVAERVYDYVVERVDQARSAGETIVTFRAGDVRDALGLDSKAIVDVCQVLETKVRLPERAGIEYIDKTGPKQGAGTAFRFRILRSNGDEPRMATTQVEASEGERLARLESNVETLMRDMTEVRADVRDLRTEMRSEIGGVRTEMRSEIGSVRTEMRAEFGSVSTEIGDLRAMLDRNFMWTLGVLLAMWVTVIVAIIVAILVR